MAGGAAAQTQLRFEPSAPIIDVGETGQLAIMLDTASEVRTIEVRVQFDPAVVSSMGGDPGAGFIATGCQLFEGFQLETPETWYGYSVILGATCWLTGPAELFVWYFQGAGGGTSAITVVDVALYDPAGELIPDVTLDDTSITVRAGEPPEVTNPGPQSNAALDDISLQIAATDPEEDTLEFGAQGIPDGLSIDPATGLISGTIACTALSGSPFAVAVDVDDGNGNVVTVEFTWTVTAAATSNPIGDLLATQQLTGNDTDGTTRIALTWSGNGGGQTVRVFRKGFGGYPGYDDSGGSVPSAPASIGDALGTGWTEVATVSNSGDQDEPVTRDFWYYVAFVENACGGASGVSNLAGGTLNYHLGDVLGPAPEPESGNNLVELADVSLLGFHYATQTGDDLFLDRLDIGPTSDGSVNGRPLTDGEIEFEDLILFGLNYSGVSKIDPAPDPLPRNDLVVFLPGQEPAGGTFEVELWLAGDGRLKGLSLPLTWDAAVVRPLEAVAGPLASGQGGTSFVRLTPSGAVDVVLFSAPATGFAGRGLLATVSFEVVGEGQAGIGVGQVVARDVTNADIDLIAEVRSGTPEQLIVPEASLLHGNFPNPFNPTTTLKYGVAKEGRVQVLVYDVGGRLVRRLVDEEFRAGTYEVVWNGTDEQGRRAASGVYLARLIAQDAVSVRRMLMAK